MPAKRIIPIGTRFGKLTVVAERMISRNGKNRRHLECVCDCGGTIVTLVESVTSGKTLSCGCIRRAVTGALRRSHGQSKSPEHETWMAMSQRCHNPANQDYHHYGGRGITICKRWRSFENFLADMGPKPSPKHSIERLKNDVGYQPDNCVWATHTEQQRNCRRNTNLTLNGKTQCLSAWAEELGMPYTMLQQRVWRGWSDEDALLTPRLR